uniref:DUF834 domain-containing protein n=1 Tax=Oryza barthii TaxID=65489 RepID=A0A0D3GSX3_9ORYZ
MSSRCGMVVGDGGCNRDDELRHMAVDDGPPVTSSDVAAGDELPACHGYGRRRTQPLATSSDAARRVDNGGRGAGDEPGLLEVEF